MNKIKIMDSKNGFLTFDLYDLLKILEKKGSKYNWAIIDIYATAKNDSNLNILDIEKRVNDSNEIFILTFSEIFELSRKLNQTIDGTIIASINKFPDFINKNNTDFEKDYDIVIQAIDSNHWTIYSDDSNILEEFVNSFENVRFS